MAYSVTYNFNPKDTIWVLDGNSIKESTCVQTFITIQQNTQNVITTIINYLVLFKCENGTKTIQDDSAFSTLADALAALENKLSQSCT